MNRRRFLTTLALGASVPLLQACSGGGLVPQAPSAPTTAAGPSQPTAAARPAAPQATQAAAAGALKEAPTGGRLMHAPEANPKRGGVLRTAYGITVSHYDFHQGGGGPLVMAFDNLVALDMSDGLATIIPELAESWEISPDGRTYTFKVRDGVKFHDGTPLTADDVIATLQRIVSPPANVASVYQQNLAVVDRIEPVDKLTLRVVLKHAWKPFLAALTGVNMVIYSKKSLEENNYDLRKVIAPGTGAFIYKEYKQAERWVFERNPNYWNKNLPYVDRIEMLHVPAWTDRGTAVLTDQADFSWNVSMDMFQEGQQRQDVVNVRILPHFGASYHFEINNQRKPFDDPRVRRAIHLAVSRHNLIKVYSGQEYITMDRWVSHANTYSMPLEEIQKLPGYRPDKKEDIAQAKQLLADAGYPDGFDMELMSADVAPHAQIMSPAFQDELLRTLNIRSTIKVLERSLLTDFLRKGEYDMQLSTDYGTDVPDPELLWSNQLRSGGSQNYSKYSNPKLDQILDQLQTESDDAARERLFRQGMEVLDEQPPFYLIGFADHLPMWRKQVKGIVANWLHTQWGRMHTVWLDA